jgi:hypothetical protein
VSTVNFYKHLKPLKLPIAEVFHSANFSDVPSDWHIIISDIKNSTAAVKSGNHNDVNLAAAGSLIAALNIAKRRGIEIPFFFGGDGGTFLVPEELLIEVLTALHLHNNNIKKNFGLELHMGSVPIKDIIVAGHYVKIAKVQLGSSFPKSVTVGDGLHFAEQLIKGGRIEQTRDIEKIEELNMNGLECRWDKIKPPTEENEIVCYLIESLQPEEQIEVYRTVLQKIDEIYGDLEKRNPLSLERMKLLLSFQKIKKEMLLKYGKWKSNYFTISFIKTFLGRLFFRYNWKLRDFEGKAYLSQLISNADTLTIDGRINTIITGKMDKRMLLLSYLKKAEEEGTLIYGHHISKESIMTCYIENRAAKHIHFVDGSDGGYTEAAKELKQKLQNLPGNKRSLTEF